MIIKLNYQEQTLKAKTVAVKKGVQNQNKYFIFYDTLCVRDLQIYGLTKFIFVSKKVEKQK